MKKIKFQFKSIFNKSSISILIVSIVFLSSSFVAGMFATKGTLEETSHYIASVVETRVPTKDLLAITLEKETSTASLPDHYQQFNQLYGSFRQTRITFTSGYNLTHEESVSIDEIDSSNDKLAAIFIGPINGYEEYHQHYKHDCYPVELMFPTAPNNSQDPIYQKVFISTKQAYALLEARHVTKEAGDDYSKKQYESLIDTGDNKNTNSVLPITVNGLLYNCRIKNIYYPDTYYVEGIKHTIGECIFTSFQFPGNLNLQNAYFMSKYDYENRFFMKYINNLYNTRDHRAKCVKQNLTSAPDEDRILSFFYGKNKKDNSQALEIVFIIFSVGLLLVEIFLVYNETKKYFLEFLSLQIVVSFIPYSVFLVIYTITNNVLLFSEFGLKFNAALMAIYIASCLIIFVIKRHQYNKKKMIEGLYEDGDI